MSASGRESFGAVPWTVGNRLHQTIWANLGRRKTPELGEEWTVLQIVSITILKPGIHSTVQDLGRVGSLEFGINPTGVMDRAAARIVNTLVGNRDPDAVVEMHFPAAEIEFGDDTQFAIGGADFDAELSGRAVANWSSAFAARGDRLRFRSKIAGNRAYVAIAAGIKVERWLGSSSTNTVVGLGGFAGRALKAGDELPCERSPVPGRSIRAGSSLLPRYSRFPTIRVVAAAEFGLLTAPSETTFARDGFTLTNECDRMGFRLAGKPLHMLSDTSMISAGVTFGTIQLLPDGQLIVLMADHQTSGGYPRIANVISADIPVLAQCGPGDGVSFEIVSIAEAERLAMLFEKELNFLSVGCRLLAK